MDKIEKKMLFSFRYQRCCYRRDSIFSFEDFLKVHEFAQNFSAHKCNDNLDNLTLQAIGIKKMTFTFFVVMQAEAQNVHQVMFVGKIEG